LPRFCKEKENPEILINYIIFEKVKLPSPFSPFLFFKEKHFFGNFQQFTKYLS